MKGCLGLFVCMQKEYYVESLTELKIIGNCIRIVSDRYRIIIKKEYLIAIISNYEGTCFLFKDTNIKIKDISGFGNQISAIIKSELEGSIQQCVDLLGLNT